MATQVLDKQDLFGNLRAEFHTVTFSSSYSTGGEAVEPSFKFIQLVIAEQIIGGYAFQYDYTNKKLKAFYFDYNNAADGVAIEVPATTNLSTIAPKVLFIGV